MCVAIDTFLYNITLNERVKPLLCALADKIIQLFFYKLTFERITI